MTVSCLIAASSLALVPAPREQVETGGTTTNGSVTFVRDATLPAEGYRLIRRFYRRMLTHAARLRQMKIPCAPLDPPGSARKPAK